jgi:ribosomal protein S15P/S13E
MGGEGQARSTRVTLQLRVPAERLDQALREIKRLGRGDEVEKISSEDVTDEYIDVQARVDNQRHLEEQLALLLKQATSIESALKVHQELTTVRTEIDRLEGRRRFLEKESAMAKLSLTLEPHRQVLAVAEQTGFGATFRHAAADAVELTVGLIDFAIRALGFLVPLAVIFGLPTAALVLALRRRRRRMLAAVA